MSSSALTQAAGLLLEETLRELLTQESQREPGRHPAT